MINAVRLQVAIQEQVTVHQKVHLPLLILTQNKSFWSILLVVNTSVLNVKRFFVSPWRSSCVDIFYAILATKMFGGKTPNLKKDRRKD